MDVQRIKDKYTKGTRIRLIQMNDMYATLPSGLEGAVDYVDDVGTIHMRWDNGSSLGLIPGEDTFTVIE